MQGEHREHSSLRGSPGVDAGPAPAQLEWSEKPDLEVHGAQTQYAPDRHTLKGSVKEIASDLQTIAPIVNIGSGTRNAEPKGTKEAAEMFDLRDMRVPGLGLAPMKPTDDLYPRDYDPLIAAFLRSKHRRSWPSALLARLRIAARLGVRPYRGAWRAARTHPGRGFNFGRLAR